MGIDDINRWDLIRHRLKTKPIDEVFIEFANIISKNFMEKEPEQWYRFCDGDKTQGDFHKQWLDMFMENNKNAIECAREHHKTSWVLCLILFLMWRNDNFSVIYFSATQGQAKSKLKELEELWKRNKDWLDVDKSDDTWTKLEKQFDNGSFIKGEGWGTAVEGAHVQLIVMDDILQERGSMDDEEVWEFYAQVVSPMSTESGNIVLVGTKKRSGDIFDKVQNNPEWSHAKYPSTPDDPIFPEKWPVERLKAKRREMGSRYFNREFGLQVIIGEEVLMPPKWNEDNTDPDNTYPDSSKGGLAVMGFDPAISPTGDYAAFYAMKKLDDGSRKVLHFSREKGMSLQSMITKLQILDNRYTFQVIVVENNSFQQLIEQEAIERTALPIEGHTTSSKKSDPVEGIPRIAVNFENGKYLYPYKDDKDIEKTEMMFDALNSLKLDKGKLTNNHTPDIVMAKYLAEQGLLKFENNNNVLTEPFCVGVKGSL